MPQQMSTQLSFSSNSTSDLNSEFVRQLSNKVNILKSLSNTIKNSIQVIDKSLKYIEIKSDKEVFKACKANEVLEKLKSISDNCTLSFYNLKSHSDFGTERPAINIIEQICKEYKDLTTTIQFPLLAPDEAIYVIPAFYDMANHNKVEAIKE
jgi:hypothetical protein